MRSSNSIRFRLSTWVSLCFLVVSSTAVAFEKKNISADAVQALSKSLYEKISADQFRPDLLIGVARGGLIPLGYLAHETMFDIRDILTLSVQSYEGEKQTTLQMNLPMPEQGLDKYKSILIIDDIADSGKTFDFVLKQVQAKFNNAVIKTASLYYKKRSIIKPDYYVEETADLIVFPWEIQEVGASN